MATRMIKASRPARPMSTPIVVGLVVLVLILATGVGILYLKRIGTTTTQVPFTARVVLPAGVVVSVVGCPVFFGFNVSGVEDLNGTVHSSSIVQLYLENSTVVPESTFHCPPCPPCSNPIPTAQFNGTYQMSSLRGSGASGTLTAGNWFLALGGYSNVTVVAEISLRPAS
ncbi:MAG: hypothetical protein L3K15_06075 [Thermoplasmata archaeon]|nr:hypothetical protein [Thermoplasmata archaeon]